MRLLLLFTCMLGLVSAQCQDFYGKAFTPENPIEALEGDLSNSIQVKGKIESTCVVKGCWMKINLSDGNSVRVTFKDYGFFVPTSGVEGQEAIVHGLLEKKEISVDRLKHFAEDEGKTEEEISQITQPKVEYTFVADGVLIKS